MTKDFCPHPLDREMLEGVQPWIRCLPVFYQVSSHIFNPYDKYVTVLYGIISTNMC